MLTVKEDLKTDFHDFYLVQTTPGKEKLSRKWLVKWEVQTESRLEPGQTLSVYDPVRVQEAPPPAPPSAEYSTRLLFEVTLKHTHTPAEC